MSPNAKEDLVPGGNEQDKANSGIGGVSVRSGVADEGGDEAGVSAEAQTAGTVCVEEEQLVHPSSDVALTFPQRVSSMWRYTVCVLFTGKAFLPSRDSMEFMVRSKQRKHKPS